MKAAFQKEYGGSEVLTVGVLPRPPIGKAQVLVQVYASSINPRDWLIRAGKYQLQFMVPRFPLILGSDLAGIVVEVGPEVVQFKPGDKVMGMKNPGAGLGCHAELVTVNANALALIPDNLPFDQAGGLPLCALTAWQALVGNAKIKPGDTLLVIGASGGVGSFAVQIGTALGAAVSAVCSESNRELAVGLGACQVIDYKKEDFKKMPTQYDIVFDTIGRESLSQCAAILKPGGVYVSTVPKPANLIDAALSTLKHVVVKSARRAAVVMVKPDGVALQQIAQLVQAGKIRTVIDTVYPLSEVKQAHDLSRSLRAKGKIILKIHEWAA